MNKFAFSLQDDLTRETMIKMVIKFCDISNPSKNWENYMRWTRLITEEFYLQGDEEKKRGLKVYLPIAFLFMLFFRFQDLWIEKIHALVICKSDSSKGLL